ncbi:uncharacterized protein MKK02DRAFT_44159 [Dioszegia hungarica]|uniref:Uncharacterized protein n=1 Tax=Dioszegia hungarica TaxID=4972 RepID=A0AA38HAQ0_9TREE|nr:uncharacterized protein MKK02DRAFT_44159 [Dioszegia hungarica]KAI9635469.1 hypothetical protein MKK02DRAFT_44159 [Dioszegia hungarica]
MDEGLFIFTIFCGFLCVFALIFCFLSTCLGIPLRRADVLSAFSFPTPASIRAKDEARRRRLAERQRLGMVDGEGYEMDSMARGVERAGVGGDDWEMMRRSGGRGAMY